MPRNSARLLRAIFVPVLILLLALPTPARALDELKNTDPDRYYILLDCVNQIVTVYERDEAGDYSRIVRQFLCTTGKMEVDPEDPEDVATPTPRGIWRIGGRERFGKFANFSGEYARYWTQIVGSVYFHSIMFSRRDVDHLQRSAFRNLGRAASHGCVRLYVEDARWLYYHACPGTRVEVSTTEKRDSARAAKLKTELSFSAYNTFQKTIADPEPLDNPAAWVTVEGVRLRRGCGDNFASLKKLPLGAELEVLLEGEAWVKVRYGEREGYVKRGYISLTPGAADTVPDATLMEETTWLMPRPDLSGEGIVKVPSDTAVALLGTLENGVARVAYWGDVGYVPLDRIYTGWGPVPKISADLLLSADTIAPLLKKGR